MFIDKEAGSYRVMNTSARVVGLSGRLRQQAHSNSEFSVNKNLWLIEIKCGREPAPGGVPTMAQCQPTSMPNDTPHSRASPLPQGFGNVREHQVGSQAAIASKQAPTKNRNSLEGSG